MKTASDPTRAALQADPRIVKKTRRDNAAYAFFDGLPGERDHDYLHQPVSTPQVPRPLPFGRSSR